MSHLHQGAAASLTAKCNPHLLWRIQTSMATRAPIKKCTSDPAMAGVYYFMVAVVTPKACVGVDIEAVTCGYNLQL